MKGLEDVNWERVAAPQSDGYDLDVTLRALGVSRYSERLAKDVPAHAPLVWPNRRARWVSLADHSTPDPSFHTLDFTAPQVLAGLRCLEVWPEGHRLAADLLVAIAPMTLGAEQKGHGCTCGQFADDWGWIYVTADNPWGFAEGVVHEAAHWKLRALGIWFEEWTPDLLANLPTDLYTSPVRKDKARPMGAVLHAQYSYIHVAAMCTALLRNTLAPADQDIEWTALQLRRITEGRGTLLEHARGTTAGAAFLRGLDAWTGQVLADGWKAVLAAGGRMPE